MLRRMLLLLGETPSSLSARQYAFRVARSANAELAGLAGIDLSYIEAPMPGGIGSSAYKVRLEQQLTNQADASRLRLRERYERESEAHGIAFEWLSFRGDPIETLYLACEMCDLVVTGHDTTFHGNIRRELSETLAKLVLPAPRPIVVCGDETNTLIDVLVAYDGSVPAMRAVQIYALLRPSEDQRIVVTSIDASQELAARRAHGAAGYLRRHGYEVEAFPIASRLQPADVLRIEVADRKIGTVVMGAFGHRGLQKLLFGSVTTSLVTSPPCALFLYH
jgi:nucleotide-binding universal stress UspA family protein